MLKTTGKILVALMSCGAVIAAVAASGIATDSAPGVRSIIPGGELSRWTFDDDQLAGWRAVHDCALEARQGVLIVTSEGGDPFLHSPTLRHEGGVRLTMRVRSTGAGDGQTFWLTEADARWSEGKSAHFPLHHDGEWHEAEVFLDVQGALTQVRIDPGCGPGRFEIDWVALTAAQRHPLEIEKLSSTPDRVVLQVRNHSPDSIELEAPQTASLAPGKSIELSFPAPGGGPFKALSLQVAAKGYPTLHRRLCVIDPQAATEESEAWRTLGSGDVVAHFASDGSGAFLERKGQRCAVVAPLIRGAAKTPALRCVSCDADSIRFEGEGVAVDVTIAGDEVTFSIEAESSIEGPVLRALGSLEQGLFAGLEYLGRGEQSSSNCDIETEARHRFLPMPGCVTMPLMAVVTDLATVAVTWDDMSLCPSFATPNVFDGGSDHRMALHGSKVKAVARLTDQGLDESILWAVRRQGLPTVPGPVRSDSEQWQLCKDALEGPLRSEEGWGHCVEPKWRRQPYASFASTWWRLTGEVLELDGLAGGGSHVRNDAIYFVSGRVKEWLSAKSAVVEGLLAQQQGDGLFHYDGKYRRGHFETTASGYCAQKAVVLLEYACLTGDDQAGQAGRRVLDAMRRFRTPRGAQTWEISLHTPDLLASAYLIWAYVRGYELTGDAQYLQDAQRWAVRGLPFVYLWSEHPVMAYATVPVFGATNWRAPLWIGLPVQWCGIVYAYALGLLAPYEDSLDWGHLAAGIMGAAEQMQSTRPETVGCLPDAFQLQGQAGIGPFVNPCSLVSLRLLLDSKVDSLAFAAGAQHRIVAPFPVTVSEGVATIEARKGLAYQVLIDGKVIRCIRSIGVDRVPLTDPGEQARR